MCWLPDILPKKLVLPTGGTGSVVIIKLQGQKTGLVQPDLVACCEQTLDISKSERLCKSCREQTVSVAVLCFRKKKDYRKKLLMMRRYSPEQIYSPIQRRKNASTVQLK